jgi:hypothetical protein
MKKKKIHIHKKMPRQQPRIPEEGRERIKTGGPHKNKKGYDRKKNKKEQREDTDASRFLFFVKKFLNVNSPIWENLHSKK